MRFGFKNKDIKSTVIKFIIMLFLFGAGFFVGASLIVELNRKKKNYWKSMSEKHFSMMRLFDQWLVLSQKGKCISDYFYKNNLKNVAIYGMGYLGERLYSELKKTDIQIKYAIDKNITYYDNELVIVSPDSYLEQVDAIIITPLFYHEEIKSKLKYKINTSILALEDILNEL